MGYFNFTLRRNSFASASVNGCHVPGSNPASVIFPIAQRTNRNVGCPTAAVIRRT
jgi:hypothetical protein